MSSGTRDDPWRLQTPSLQSDIEAYRDPEGDPPALVVIASARPRSATTCARSTTSTRCWSRTVTGWRSAPPTSRRSPKPGTVEAWARSSENPVGGFYGLKKGLRGRFGNYVPPVLEALGLAELEHNARNNRIRAI